MGSELFVIGQINVAEPCSTFELSLLLQMVLLLKEFLSSGDIAEATRCLQELEVPHFHHELVYEVSVY